MDSRTEERSGKYPHGKVRVYWSVAITVSSTILALLVLKSPLLLLSYLIFTLILAAIVLLLKMRFLSMRRPDPSEESTETVSWAQRWGPLLSLFVVMIAFVSLPLLLARFNPQIWFVSLVSYSSGVSIAEALFFLKTRRD